MRDRLGGGLRLAVSGLLSAIILSTTGSGSVLRAADAPAAKSVSAEDAEHFERFVRPVLATRCFACHGPKKQESGLRTDARDGLTKGGDSGPAVVPGRPDASLLLKAVRHDGDFKMPPDGRLEAAQVAALETWIRRGAPWPETTPPNATASGAGAAQTLWSLKPVVRPAIPAIPGDDWSRTPIDRFVLQKQIAAGLAPSAEAPRAMLLRRATFDLLGLPPTPAETAAFVADESPDAWERTIDRLLASPRYGERWGRHWLDVARYADNKGYVFFEQKEYPWAWTYRDYVVRAFNTDLPFDRFVVEQLAADRLDPAERSETKALAALGFLTTGGRFMNNVHDILDDRIDVVTRGLLGLTVTCARCHDHKFDPVPQVDYYALYGVFRSASEPTLAPLLDPPPDTDEYRAFDKEMAARLQKLEDFATAKVRALAESGRTRAAEYLLAAQAQHDRPPTDDFMLITDKGDLNPLLIVRWKGLLDATRRKDDPVWIPWHALAALPADAFSARAPGLLQELRAAAHAPEDGRERSLPREINSLVLEALTESPPTTLKEAAERYAAVLLRIEKESTAEAAPQKPEEPRDERRVRETAALRRVFHGPDAPPDVPRAAGWGFLSLLPDRPSQEEYKKLVKEVETWSATGKGAPPRAMALVDDPVPTEARVFLRGNPSRLGPAVPRRFLSSLDPAQKSFGTGSGRLELARAIAAPSNPLTARVLANRIWMHHFGTGLVDTPGDFGTRGSPPSHPELLDWLAAELVAHDGSVKHLHRLILASATWRQTSRPGEPSQAAVALGAPGTRRADPRRVDPDNRLLSRANRRRLDFESLRDALLAVSGSLDDRIGGPAAAMFGSGFVARRTLYGAIDRLDVPGLLTTFDFPNPAASSPQRTVTTVAPQALWLMNDPFVLEAASRLAKRSDLASIAPLPARVEAVQRLVFGREPAETDTQAALALLGDKPTPATWERYVHALLMTNEFAIVD